MSMPGRDLQRHLLDCVEHSLLTERDLKQAKETMVAILCRENCNITD